MLWVGVHDPSDRTMKNPRFHRLQKSVLTGNIQAGTDYEGDARRHLQILL